MTGAEIFFESLKLLLAMGAAGFTYFKFFREGTHQQRIEFDIDCSDLGVAGDKERIIEIGCTAENKGNVERRFDVIRVKLKGIQKGAPLGELEGHGPRLAFPLPIATASLIPEKWQYFWVRPGVKQRFPLVLKVPAQCTHIHVRSTFKYKGTDNVHSAERAFHLGNRQTSEHDT